MTGLRSPASCHTELVRDWAKAEGVRENAKIAMRITKEEQVRTVFLITILGR